MSKWKLDMAVRIRMTAVAVSLAAAAVPLWAQSSCAEVRALVAITKAKSPDALSRVKASGKVGYRADLIHAFRAFQLEPSSRAAADHLLRLTPSNEVQQTIVMTLGDSLCDAESMLEMKALSRVRDGLSVQLAAAVLLTPQHMPLYIAYSKMAAQDPHSDYAMRMARVCHRAHDAFVDALDTLPPEDRQFIAQHVIEPATCKAIALPEAER
jgi:hypothetical protein